MGWDIIQYKGRQESFRDFDLWTAAHFLRTESSACTAGDPDAEKLANFVGEWEWLGPGVFVGADPEKFIGDSERRKTLLLELLDRTSKRISDFGSEVPLDYLKTHINQQHAYYTSAQPVEHFLDVLQKYRKLIEG